MILDTFLLCFPASSCGKVDRSCGSGCLTSTPLIGDGPNLIPHLRTFPKHAAAASFFSLSLNVE